MNLTYFDTKGVEHLVEEYFNLSFNKEDIPFKSKILPIGLTHIFYIETGKQKVIVDTTETPMEGLMVTGQYFRSYIFSTNTITSSIGASLHPTTLYKLLNTDISKLKNKHLPLNAINSSLNDKLVRLFETHKTSNHLFTKLNDFFLNTSLTINKDTDYIDNVINLIRSKDGLLDIKDIVEQTHVSQKTLETHFKKIVGLTPGKYVRLYRFLKLIRKYESQELKLNDLIYMYDYYDQSHFNKDFKLFMLESPKSYFKKDYPLLKKYLNK